MTWKEIAVRALHAHLMERLSRMTFDAGVFARNNDMVAEGAKTAAAATANAEEQLIAPVIKAEQAVGAVARAPFVDTQAAVKEWTKEYNQVLQPYLAKEGIASYTITTDDMIDHAVRYFMTADEGTRIRKRSLRAHPNTRDLK